MTIVSTARTSPALVNEVVEWQDGSSERPGPPIQLDSFINQANSLVNWLDRQDTDSELDDATLIQIETQLAAHFYAVQRDPQYQSKSTQGASGSFQGATGFSLQATHYGQTAMLLDFTGKLTKRNKEAQEGRKIATTIWLGHQDHSEDPYP